MDSYSKQMQIRWSDMDPNFHLRHSVYYDLGATLRTFFLTEHGITPAVMMEKQIGPILFREECVFKREIHFGDPVEINVKLVKCTEDMGRWTMRHEVWKNSDTLSAIITIDGAWMHTGLRKLILPPPEFHKLFEEFPRADDFEWTRR